jgi:hypothetical protein
VLVLMFVLVDPGHPYTSSESSSRDESVSRNKSNRPFLWRRERERERDTVFLCVFF